MAAPDPGWTTNPSPPQWRRAGAPGPPSGSSPRALPPGHPDGPGAGAAEGNIPASAAWWALPGALAAFVLAGIGGAIGTALSGSDTSGLFDLGSEVGLWAGLLATVIFVSHRFGSRRLSRDFGLRFKPVDLAIGFGAFLTIFAAASIVLALFYHTKYAGSNVQILSAQKSSGVNFAIVSVLVAVGAPFFEELFFRGYLRTALEPRLGSHGAIFAQAVFFALAHAGEVKGYANVSIVLAMFTVGVVLGYTAKLSGRLAPGMAAHCLFNLVAVISIV